MDHVVHDEAQTARSPLNVLILWADEASANMGVRVLATGAKRIAQRAWGEEILVSLQDFEGTQTGVRLGIKQLVRETLLGRGQISNFVRQHDVVLDTGAGDSFTDIYGLKRLAMMFAMQRIIVRARVPLVLTPQTIGPFGSRPGKYIARKVLAAATLVMTRDQKSTNASQMLDRIVDLETTDVVFALDQVIPHSASFDILLNVSGLLWNRNPHVDHIAYRTSVYQLISELQKSGHHVTLLAHVIGGISGDDDETAIREILKTVEVAAIFPQSLDEIRRIIAASNLVVGARMHACLNALSLGVPAIPWAYSRKFAPLLDAVGWKRTIDLREVADPVAATMSLVATDVASLLVSEAEQVQVNGLDKLQLAIDVLAQQFKTEK